MRDEHYQFMDREMEIYEIDCIPSSSTGGRDTFQGWLKKEEKSINDDVRIEEIKTYLSRQHLQEGWEYYENEKPESDYNGWVHRRLSHYDTAKSIKNAFHEKNPESLTSDTTYNQAIQTTEYPIWLNKTIKLFINNEEKQIKQR